jgi:hypothetical protein
LDWTAEAIEKAGVNEDQAIVVVMAKSSPFMALLPLAAPC